MVYKKFQNKKFLSIICLVIFTFLLLPHFSYAQTDELQYRMLEPLPGVGITEGSATTTTSRYFSGVVTLVISLSLVLAVLRIIYGGFLYMTTDAFQGKSEAKETIRNALIGFVLVAAAWLIVSLVNPNLTKLDIKPNKIETSGSLLTEGEVIERPNIDSEQAYFEGCQNCNILGPTIPHKDISLNGCATTNPVNDAPVGACIVNTLLRERLLDLVDEIADSGPVTNDDWWVTEMYPPTVTHESGCHNPPNGGRCVDINFRQSVDVTPIKVYTFLSSLSRVRGLNYIYEVETSERKKELLKDPYIKKYYSDNIVVTCNQEHFHVGFFKSEASNDATCK